MKTIVFVKKLLETIDANGRASPRRTAWTEFRTNQLRMAPVLGENKFS